MMSPAMRGTRVQPRRRERPARSTPALSAPVRSQAATGPVGSGTANDGRRSPHLLSEIGSHLDAVGIVQHVLHVPFLASCGTAEVRVFSASQEGRGRFRREDQVGHVLLSNHMGVACLPRGQPLLTKEGPRVSDVPGLGASHHRPLASPGLSQRGASTGCWLVRLAR